VVAERSARDAAPPLPMVGATIDAVAGRRGSVPIEVSCYVSANGVFLVECCHVRCKGCTDNIWRGAGQNKRERVVGDH